MTASHGDTYNAARRFVPQGTDASGSAPMLAIQTEALCKDYRLGFWRRRVRVLHSLDLSVEEGETFGYLDTQIRTGQGRPPR